MNFSGGTNQLHAIALSADLKRMAVRRQSGIIEAWDVEKSNKLGEWEAAPPSGKPMGGFLHQTSIAFLPGASQVVILESTNISVREFSTGKLVRSFESPPAEAVAIVVSPNGNRAAGLLRNNRRLAFWDVPDGKTISYPPSMLTGLCRVFSHDGAQFAVGRNYAQIHRWDLESGQYLEVLQGDRSLSSSTTATDLAFLDGKRLAAVFDRETLQVFALSPTESTTLIPRPSRIANKGGFLEIRSLAVSGNGQRLAVAGMRMGTQLMGIGSGSDYVPVLGEVQVWDGTSLK